MPYLHVFFFLSFLFWVCFVFYFYIGRYACLCIMHVQMAKRALDSLEMASWTDAMSAGNCTLVLGQAISALIPEPCPQSLPKSSCSSSYILKKNCNSDIGLSQTFITLRYFTSLLRLQRVLSCKDAGVVFGLFRKPLNWFLNTFMWWIMFIDLCMSNLPASLEWNQLHYQLESRLDMYT